MRSESFPHAFVFPPMPPELPSGWRWADSVLRPGASVCDERCAARHARAFELESRPHPDPEAERWRRANQALTRLLAAWFERFAAEEAAFERWFGGREPVLRFPAEPMVMFEWMVLGYRPVREGPTCAETALLSARWRNAQVEALARACVAAPVTLLRVAAAEPAAGLTLEPVCPPGPPVLVPDRGNACLAHEGGLVGGRLLPAGRWSLLRHVGPVVPPAAAAALWRDLDQRLARRGASRLDPAPLLRPNPEALTDLLATHAV